MNAEEFLKSIDIELNSTTLVVNIDGFNRQPDLCSIMEMYANYKVKEIADSIKSFGIHLPKIN
jgi:hypothetical protein